MVDTLQGITAKKVIEILTKQLVTPYFYTDPNTIKSVVKSKLKSMSLKCKISDNIKKLIVANTPKRSMYIVKQKFCVSEEWVGGCVCICVYMCVCVYVSMCSIYIYIYLCILCVCVSVYMCLCV